MGPPPGSRPYRDADAPEPSRSEQGDQASTPQSAPPPLRQQLIGACRADERLRLLPTFNVSCSAADDQFISHLSQVRSPPSSRLLLRVSRFIHWLLVSAALRGFGGRHARQMPLRPPRLPSRWQGPERRRPHLPNNH
jgi:hypothetical protein